MQNRPSAVIFLLLVVTAPLALGLGWACGGGEGDGGSAPTERSATPTPTSRRTPSPIPTATPTPSPTPQPLVQAAVTSTNLYITEPKDVSLDGERRRIVVTAELTNDSPYDVITREAWIRFYDEAGNLIASRSAMPTAEIIPPGGVTGLSVLWPTFTYRSDETNEIPESWDSYEVYLGGARSPPCPRQRKEMEVADIQTSTEVPGVLTFSGRVVNGAEPTANITVEVLLYDADDEIIHAAHSKLLSVATDVPEAWQEMAPGSSVWFEVHFEQGGADRARYALHAYRIKPANCFEGLASNAVRLELANSNLATQEDISTLSGGQSSLKSFTVVGEILNDTADWIERPSVSGLFFDPSGVIIDGDWGYLVFPDLIGPGEVAPFKIQVRADAPHGLNIASSELFAHGRPTSRRDAGDLEITDVSQYFDDLGDFSVRGHVRNKGSSPYTSIEVLGTFYDASGKVVEAIEEYLFEVDEIPPGGSAPFDLSVAPNVSDPVATYNLKAEGYKQ